MMERVICTACHRERWTLTELVMTIFGCSGTNQRFVHFKRRPIGLEHSDDQIACFDVDDAWKLMQLMLKSYEMSLI